MEKHIIQLKMLVKNNLLCSLNVPSSVFAPCHEVIPPGPFVTSCSSDICNGLNNTCSSLEAYATQCSNAGICIDWRTSTDGQCGKIDSQ